jgi:serine/threonine protein kinase
MAAVALTNSEQPIEKYLDVLQRSKLAERPVLVKAINSFKKETVDTPDLRKSVTALSRYLIKAGVITAWQNAMLMEGRHKGFHLGKYKLLDHLGTGGMSTVYLGEHTSMKRLVALKVLHPNRKDEKTFLKRFLREAQAIATLDHPNVVKVFDVDNDGKVYYMAMEYVEGIDLQRRIDKKGPLNFVTAAHCIRQAADGLAHAHARGLIHRDIKPANLLVDRTNTLKLLDLGLVQLVGSSEQSLTIEHNEKVLGTADYLAPEQAIDSHRIDARADIYGLGCTFYFLLTGSAPFPEGTVLERLVKHQTAKPKGIDEFRPDAPADLIQIFNWMTEKKPDDRYSSAADVSRALTEWLKARQAKPKGEDSKDMHAPQPPKPPVVIRAPVAVATNGDQAMSNFLHTVTLSDADVKNIYSGRRPSASSETSNLQTILTVVIAAATVLALGFVVWLMQK